ncbi:MAG: ABC transporter permease [Acidimicrobiia bacterium]|nr:ABC transporter permease [Acidimicrobiia bacterium]
MGRLRYFARETVISLRRNLMMTIAGVLTVTVSLSLFGGGLLLTKWAGHGTERIKGDVKLEAFMQVHATDQQIADVQAALESDPQVKSVKFLDKEAAFEEFKKIFKEQPELVQNINADSLPVSFRIAPVQAEITPVIQRRYEAMSGVDEVATPEKAIKGLIDVTDKVQLGLLLLSLILLVSSLFLIVNTIRLATFARRREIEVMKLVGASNWFVRVPFLAEGLAQGLTGAGIAVSAVIALKYAGFDNWFKDPDTIFNRFEVTNSDVLFVAFLVIIAGVVIGLLGSIFGLRRFLRT